MLYKNISEKVLKDILNKASKMELDVSMEQGSLLDNYLIYNINDCNQMMTLGRGKAHKYIMIVEVYVNEWSSRWDIITTDSYHRVKQYFEEI